MEESYWLNVAPAANQLSLIQRESEQNFVRSNRPTYVLFKLIIKSILFKYKVQITIIYIWMCNGKTKTNV